MRFRVALAVILATTLAQPLTGGRAWGDERIDTAVQTALSVGQAIGAATACPDIPRARIKTVTERFAEAVKQFGPSQQVATSIGGAFDQGIVFGGQSIAARQLRCDTAGRDLLNWDTGGVSLVPLALAPAPPQARPAPPPAVVADQAPVFATQAPVLLSPPRVAPAAVAPAEPVVPEPAATAAVQGVTGKEIRLGMVAPFTGPAKELGRQMKLGIETAFNAANEAGGVHGRRLALVTADDGYEPARTGDAMKQLYETDKVFGFVGNVGTPTTAVALPYAMSRRALFFGAFTGAPLLRADPPDRYVFNYRASYAEETSAVVQYLVKVRRIKPDQIAVFAQQDGYGDAGFEGVATTMRNLNTGGDPGAVPRFGYQRNTEDVDTAIVALQQYQRLRNPLQIKAVVMVATYRTAAKFIDRTRDKFPGMIYTNVSFVGSTALAKELMALGPKAAAGVIVTQVVPPVDSYSSVVLAYKAALEKYFPGEAADYVSFEGYLDANMLIEGFRRAGPQLDTEKLVTALESVKDFDLGVGPKVNFGTADHQALHKVWGSQLDETGRYKALNLE
jgi:branched-chain amino acid transport system substrate-binding protein